MGIMNEVIDSMMRVNSRDIRLLINHDADIPGPLKALVVPPKVEDDEHGL